LTVAEAPRRSPSLVLALLLLAYIFNFLDRQMLGILAQPIKADLNLTDTQFGAVGGLAFALLYSVLAVPLAYLADRTGRSLVIAVALAVWSGFTALCGTATGYAQLFLYRLGVGFGEAGGVAPSYALIADYFPRQQRARALAIVSLGVPIGLSAGIFLGARIAAAIDWRAAFLVMGAAGILLAPIVRVVVRDVPRAPAQRQAPLGQVFPILARKPAYWLLAFAASCSSLTGYGLILWTPSIIMRSYGLDLVRTSNFLATVFLIGGAAGVLAGGWLGDRLGTADRRWYARLPALAWLVAGPTFAAALLAPELWMVWLLLLVPAGLNIHWFGPVVTAVQHLVSQPMRATASASFLLINNLVGLGVGPLLMGRLSDAMKSAYGADSLRYAAVGCTGFFLLAALLMFLAIRPLEAAWVDDARN
jgi:MFS family permease